MTEIFLLLIAVFMPVEGVLGLVFALVNFLWVVLGIILGFICHSARIRHR
ncbi:hypothetical protein [Arthrobacter sp. H5]|nr:hypothetical protein [Arthrobacter sp. H5]